jgi:hypothetical protein
MQRPCQWRELETEIVASRCFNANCELPTSAIASRNEKSSSSTPAGLEEFTKQGSGVRF